MISDVTFNQKRGPLDGIKVVEMGSLIAGPFAGRVLADFGAEVVKIEPPKDGDPLRKWGKLDDGTSLWWRVQARNKKSVTLDLRQPAARSVARRIIDKADILIENFRVGKMEEWGLGWNELSVTNPKLIMLRISGYGQSGPYRNRPGFGLLGEAMGGLRYLTAEPGHPPIRVGISIGDSLSSLHGVIGVLLALFHRAERGGRGQVIDVALYEAVFNMMESLLPDYDRLGYIRQPTGSSLASIAPSNAYLCQDNQYILIGGNSDSIFRALMHLVGRSDLAHDPSLEHNDGRVKRAVELDSAINAWTGARESQQALAQLEIAGVPAGRAYTIKDIVEDPQYLARDMICETRTKDGRTLKVPGVVPKLSETPGRIGCCGPELGEHTEEVLREAGVSDEEWKELAQEGVI